MTLIRRWPIQPSVGLALQRSWLAAPDARFILAMQLLAAE